MGNVIKKKKHIEKNCQLSVKKHSTFITASVSSHTTKFHETTPRRRCMCLIK